MQSATHRPVTNGDLNLAPRANVHTLDNGLQVVLLEDHSAPVVALQTWVRFGSADEDPSVAGIAHVFEHMLFKGTDRFPNGEIAALIEGAGGSVNAWTNYDETVYHVTLSSRFWETGFDVLSDAVLHSFSTRPSWSAKRRWCWRSFGVARTAQTTKSPSASST